MPNSPAKRQLEEFFEEVWQLAELAAGSEDRHLAPHLFELAQAIAGESRPEGGAADVSVAAPEPRAADSARGFRPGTAATEHDVGYVSATLDVMAKRLARQRMLVFRMERTGDQATVELARQLLSLMQDALEITRHQLAVLTAFDERPRSVNA